MRQASGIGLQYSPHGRTVELTKACAASSVPECPRVYIHRERVKCCYHVESGIPRNTGNMEYPFGLNKSKLLWIIVFLTGTSLVGCSAPGGWESYVTKYGKEYPSLNNKWTVDAFVGHKNHGNFKHIETEIRKLNGDAAKLNAMLADVKAIPASMTVIKIDEYLDRWKSVMFILQKVYDERSNGTLPIETMRRSAAGQMKALFKDAAIELPQLMAKVDINIRADAHNGGPCLLCRYVEKTILEMKDPDNPISLKTAVNKSEEFLGQLMRLQVRGALLYDMTCSPEDFQCRQNIVTLERTLQLQSLKLGNCTPMLMSQLARMPVVFELYMVNQMSNKILYILDSNELTSQNGNVQLENAKTRGCGLKCAKNRWNVKEPSMWTLEDAAEEGRMGYFIRGRNNCYVGFDRSFLSFIQRELDDLKAAGAENDEVLLCRPDPQPNRQTQTFTIEPVSANHSTTYMLKNVLTGKYLRTSRTKELLIDESTGGYAVNLVLQECGEDMLKGCTWAITTELPHCEDRPVYDIMDLFILKFYLLLMGVLFILLIASLVIIWLYRKQIRRDYLQYRRVNTQEVIIPPSYRFPSRT